MALTDADGFMFDLDGTLVERSPGGVRALPGAAEVIEAIRASGRPLVIFTNASHADPATIAAGVRRGGLALADEEVLTAACSSLGHLRRHHAGAPVLLIATDAARERFAAAGIELVATRDWARAAVVLTLHVDTVAIEELEAAARAVLAGAPFLTANYLPAYAGATGPILSRGAMIAAAIAKAAGRSPAVVGKPSRAAVAEISARLGVAARRIAFVGDDLRMDIALGQIAGGPTVLVRTGISAAAAAPPGRGPDAVVASVSDLLAML